MSEWSGIGPTVDAHIARYKVAQREIQLARDADEKKDIRSLTRFMLGDWGGHWTKFGSSYGLPNEDGIPMASGFVRDGDTISGREQYAADEIGAYVGAHLGVREHEMLAKAVSHYVSGSVVDQITYAANLAPNEPLFNTDIFTPYGFAVLEKPIVMPDLDPMTGLLSDHLKVHIRAFGWKPEGITSSDPNSFGIFPGISIFWYTSREDFRNGYWATMTDAERAISHEPDLIAPGLIPSEVAAWTFGKNWDTRAGHFHVEGKVPLPIAYGRRWFMSFMRFCWQEIIVRRAHKPQRAQDRRWHRSGKPILDYSILSLRREVDPSYKPKTTGEGLDYHRMVRGHWKRVHLKAMGPARDEEGRMIPETHRLTWIEEYEQGDPNLPLVNEHKATRVVR